MEPFTDFTSNSRFPNVCRDVSVKKKKINYVKRKEKKKHQRILKISSMLASFIIISLLGKDTYVRDSSDFVNSRGTGNVLYSHVFKVENSAIFSLPIFSKGVIC